MQNIGRSIPVNNKIYLIQNYTTYQINNLAFFLETFSFSASDFKERYSFQDAYSFKQNIFFPVFIIY